MAPTATRPRGQGQWALGHREPLNINERVKADGAPLEVRERIENRYAHTGFAGIDPADLRNRFRWWGLYTQRRPGIEGGRTASLEPHELEDEYFMLRIRIDGGALTTDHLNVIGETSTLYGRDSADLTDRQNIQLHWIRIEDVPEIRATARGGRSGDHRGVRGLPPGDTRLPRGRHRGRRTDRPAAGHRRDQAPLHR